MRFDRTLSLAVGNNRLKDLIAAIDTKLPLWADLLFYEAPGANYTTPNSADIAIGPNDMASLDDGDRLVPGGSNNFAPSGKIDLTQISIRAEVADQRVRVVINTQ